MSSLKMRMTALVETAVDFINTTGPKLSLFGNKTQFRITGLDKALK